MSAASSPEPPPMPWLPLLLGAAVGGILASTVGGPLAAVIGGVLGGLLGAAGAWCLRRPWPLPLRWLAALAVWVLGFGALWIAGGFVAAVIGLTAGRR